jgi:hypothetical protein
MPMPGHVFVDETKECGFLMTAAVVRQRELDVARKTVRGLVLPGQRRLHFASERDSRRQQILDALLPLTVEVTAYDGSAHPHRRQRDACLERMVADLVEHGAEMLVLERDDSVMEQDRKLLYRRVRELGYERLVYRHHRAHEEPLLAIPDAIAWCLQRGGHWKDRVHELVGEIHLV